MTILCTIDLLTREVFLPADQRIAAYDHNVDVIRFQAEPIEDFSLDLSSIKIAAKGPDKVRHDYAVDPSTVQIEEETGYITFDWPIPAGVTEMPEDMFGYGATGQLIFAVCAEIIDGSTVSKAWHSDDGIITVVAHLEPEAGGGEDPSETATNAQKIGQLQTATAILQREISGIASGTPPTADSTDDMDPDESTVYINTTDGNWYYWDGSAWQIGGVYGGAVTDTTLSISGRPADAKAVGDALAELENGGGGLTAEIKTALLACFAHVAWKDDDGQDYYDALEDALYPPISLVRITAVYTQSGDVYDNQTLDSLRPDLVVMAIYDNGTSEAVTTYALSGTLATGASTITVSYGGKTTTFTVTVTHATTQYTVTNTLTNCSNSNSATVANEDSAYSGTLTADTDYVMGTVAITMGGTDITSTAYESGTGVISIASVTGDIVITAVATAPPITVNYTYPKTATWNPQTGTLSKAIGAKGTKYRIEVDVTSISAASAYVVAAVKGSGDALFGDGQSMAGQTGTISWNHTVKADQEVGATTFKISCNKGSESSNQTAVISDIRIYEV